MSAVRYAERTGEPLVVSDATRDDRFCPGPVLRRAGPLLAAGGADPQPGQLQALLLLENRLIRGGFSDDRLDAVKLIAGQLAVSLDNARLYSSLERMVAERTEALAVANGGWSCSASPTPSPGWPTGAGWRRSSTRMAPRPPAPPTAGAGHGGHRPLQALQRPLRPRGR